MGDRQWYYARQGQQQGPISFDELRGLTTSRRLAADDLVWTDGMADWQNAGSIAALWPAPPTASTASAAPASPPIRPAPAYQAPGPQPGATLGYQSYRPVGQSYNGLAIAGFVLSLMFPLLGLILSWVALSGMKRTGNLEGKGLATAGMVISSVFVGLACLWLTAVIGIFGCMAGAGAR